MSAVFEAEDLCVFCGKDTGPYSGLFINRIPAVADIESAEDWLDAGTTASFKHIEGYACEPCTTV
jgi:hypothetical protein